MLLLRTVIFTLLVPGTVVVLIPRWLLASGASQPWASLGPVRYVGLLPLVLGAALYFRCVWNFLFTGKGTPATWFTRPVRALIGEEPSVFVSRGPYRIVRNPMYVGVTLALLGQVVLFQSWTLLAYAALGWVTFHFVVVALEEPHLREKFGESYERYCRAVPRWLPGRRRP